MLFSVIIPFYNRAGMVREVLDSVMAQAETSYEIIAVDDGSTDGTAAEIQAHACKATCLRIDNRGAPRARNAAARQARGEYLAFLDSDDLWFPFTLALYRQVIEAHGRPAIVTGKPLLFESVAAVVAPEPCVPAIEAFPTYFDAHDAWRWFGVSSFVIRRDAFTAVGGFVDQRVNAEDADLMLRLGTQPGFVHITRPCTFAYRQHAANLTRNFLMNHAGLRQMVEAEQAGRYPGTGVARANRRRIITRHLRPVILAGIEAGEAAKAWSLFQPALPWHLREGRIRFLLFASLKLLLAALRPRRKLL